LANKFVEIRLFEKGIFSNSEIGIAKFPLDGLRNKTQFDGVVKIPTKKNEIELTYGLSVREPLDKVSNLYVKFVSISKRFPLFNS